MYSPKIVERNIEKYEAASGLKLVRHKPGYVADVVAHLEKLRTVNGFSRPLSAEERDFVRNEQALSALDFRHWLLYCTIPYDGIEGGGIGKLKLWDSQEVLLSRIARAQEEEWDKWDRHHVSDGILICAHKDRQIGYTMLCRALMLHRTTLREHHRALAGTVDEKKVEELYTRDKLIYDNLPFFLRPEVVFDVKNENLTLSTHSAVTYYQANMKASFGQGVQFDFGHNTECSEWPYPESTLEMDFFPTLPQHPDTLCILESRANGRGNWWHAFSESVRKGKKVRWRYCYCPYYAEPKKYRRVPPPDWSPEEATALHAKKVYEQSVEFLGKHIALDAQQLYWWETTRKEYQDAGTLNLFLTNYGGSPEMSFQHSGRSAFPVDFLEWAGHTARTGEELDATTYELVIPSTERQVMR